MRTLNYLPVPQDSSPEFPFSTILNETEVADGTPVVRELYGDVLTNIYKILQTVKIAPTQTEDSDNSQYQLLDALQILTNKLNDSEQVLTLTGTVWSLPFDLSILPNKYFFLARAANDYAVGPAYTFKGTGPEVYPFNSAGFKTSDELLVIVDTAGVRAYSLIATSAEETPTVLNVMGIPVAYNDTDTVYVQESGQLISTTPLAADLEVNIRNAMSNPNILLQDMWVQDGFVLCFCLDPVLINYFFKQFALTNLNTPVDVVVSGITLGSTVDYDTYAYCADGEVYLTNNANTTDVGGSLAKLTYNAAAATLTYVNTTTLAATFIKTTSAVVLGGYLYTLISGTYRRFLLTTGVMTELDVFAGNTGLIFNYKNNIYFTSGEVALKW